MRRSRGVPVTAVLVVLLAAAGCTDDSTEASSTRACDAADDLEKALSDFEDALSPEATVDELRDARQRVDDAQDALDDAAEDVVEARARDVEEAWDRLDDDVSGLNGDETIGEAADALRTDAAAVRDALRELAADVDC